MLVFKTSQSNLRIKLLLVMHFIDCTARVDSTVNYTCKYYSLLHVQILEITTSTNITVYCTCKYYSLLYVQLIQIVARATNADHCRSLQVKILQFNVCAIYRSLHLQLIQITARATNTDHCISLHVHILQLTKRINITVHYDVHVDAELLHLQPLQSRLYEELIETTVICSAIHKLLEPANTDTESLLQILLDLKHKILLNSIIHQLI